MPRPCWLLIYMCCLALVPILFTVHGLDIFRRLWTGCTPLIHVSLSDSSISPSTRISVWLRGLRCYDCAVSRWTSFPHRKKPYKCLPSLKTPTGSRGSVVRNWGQALWWTPSYCALPGQYYLKKSFLPVFFPPIIIVLWDFRSELQCCNSRETATNPMLVLSTANIMTATRCTRFFLCVVAPPPVALSGVDVSVGRKASSPSEIADVATAHNPLNFHPLQGFHRRGAAPPMNESSCPENWRTKNNFKK